MRLIQDSFYSSIGWAEADGYSSPAGTPDRLGPVPVVRKDTAALTRRAVRRLPRSVLMLRVGLCALAVLILVMVFTVAADAGEPTPPAVVHEVVQGESLWEIARHYSESGDDVRRIVADIRSTNRLATSLVEPGDQIIIPAKWAYKKGETLLIRWIAVYPFRLFSNSEVNLLKLGAQGAYLLL